MKIKEIIDKVSEMYRAERKEIKELDDELRLVCRVLNEANYNKGENITLAEYNNLSQRKIFLEKEIELKAEHCDGISCVREYLMNLRFDTEVE